MLRWATASQTWWTWLTRGEDGNERLDFLTDLAKRVNKPSSQEAFVYAQVAVASVKLQKQDLDGAQKDLAQCESILDNFDSVDTIVHAAFYRTYGDFYQVRYCETGASLVGASESLTCRPGQTRIRFLLPQRPPLPCLHQRPRHAEGRAAKTSL